MKHFIDNSIPADIIEFWFGCNDIKDLEKNDLEKDMENNGLLWFNINGNEENNKKKRNNFNVIIKNKFEHLIEKIYKDRDLNLNWNNDNINTVLAKIIILDQFSRNIYKDSQAYKYDKKAIEISKSFFKNLQEQEIINIPDSAFIFLTMPLIHSEDINLHEFHKKLSSLKKNIPYSLPEEHTVVIKKFGRYPHRNEVLKRKNTPEEDEYLNKNIKHSWEN
ncbi:Bacterial protein of unknown function (DUF924) [seawater metagenome]|uniref:DUF924 domain-containing protein n=1 Tax=seawater metagenome TaxID=1561972 RepID=A0A5E8CLN4_9ZZZZ